MHAANAPSHPELLDHLAADFVAHQYDLQHLIRGIANSRTYQLSSRYPADKPRPADNAFACAAVRPLTLHQLATSLVVAAGALDTLRAGADAAIRNDPGALRTQFEIQYAGQLAGLVKNLDNGSSPYQAGVSEALFQANSREFADLVQKGGLSTRLATLTDDDALMGEVFHSVLARPPTAAENERLRKYLPERAGRRGAACEQLVWALLSSAEFRFNH
jgi:hypothetical protein